MNKNWIRFGCFSAIFLLLFSWGNLAMKDVSAGWAEFYELPPNSVDVVFMGNSHNFQTFQPQIIDDIIPIDSYVVGINGESIIVTYFELRDILKYQRPKLVVLETFALDLTDMKLPGHIFAFVDLGFWNFNKAAVAARYLTTETAQSIFPLLRTRVNWNSPAPFFELLTDSFQLKDETLEDQTRGYYPANNVIPEDVYLSAGTLPTPVNHQSLTENEKYLQKIIHLCEKMDIQLILTTAPVLKITGSQFEFYKPFDVSKFAVQNNLKWITFDQTKLNHLHFSNLSHVNSFGSIFTSVDMALAISRTMNLPVNEEKLHYYQSYLFTDYSIRHIGTEYTINLIPQNPNELLEYRFKITGVDDNKVVLFSDWQKSNNCIFTLNRSGSYIIEVDIRNPSGEYSMNTLFSTYYDEPKQ